MQNQTQMLDLYRAGLRTAVDVAKLFWSGLWRAAADNQAAVISQLQLREVAREAAQPHGRQERKSA